MTPIGRMDRPAFMADRAIIRRRGIIRPRVTTRRLGITHHLLVMTTDMEAIAPAMEAVTGTAADAPVTEVATGMAGGTGIILIQALDLAAAEARLPVVLAGVAEVAAANLQDVHQAGIFVRMATSAMAAMAVPVVATADA
jgi:hypothetical protein